MKVSIFTLGCKVNQYETQALERELLRRGHILSDFSDTSDAYIINTCTVTSVSDKKSRNIIRRAQKKAPNAVIAVCGCYPQTNPEEIRSLGVDVISGTAGRIAFLDLVEEAVRDRKSAPLFSVDDAMKRRVFESLEPGSLEGRTRALLKIEDGCVNFCSYCIIPYARGPIRSLPLAEAVKQAEKLALQGYRELVLTGIEISSWGAEWRNGLSLIDLIEAICRAVPNLRIRLGSLEPRTITAEFCQRASLLPNLCPHFHLSLQSGCDATLKRMNRKYDTTRYYESVSLLRGWFVAPAITTDLIVGFPQEDETEFTQTLNFLKKCRFTSMHIFSYSKRPGTPAASMPGQISLAEKESRSHRATSVAEEMEQEYLQGFVGSVLPVLFEEEKDGYWRGHAPNYVAVLTAGENLHNQLANVRIEGIMGDSLIGELV